MDWHTYFINMAQLVSLKSKDSSTKVGCVIVGPEKQILATGFNGFPRGVLETEEEAFHNGNYAVEDEVKYLKSISDRWVRPTKYLWVEHAERNAIYNAARHGIQLRDATAYLNWAPIPCPDCARCFIQSGITTIIGPDRPFAGKGNWESINSASLPMLNEAGIKMLTIPNIQMFVPITLDENI